jgi:hypothetical protein
VFKIQPYFKFLSAFRFTTRGYTSPDNHFHIVSKFVLICETRWTCFSYDYLTSDNIILKRRYIVFHLPVTVC